MEVHIMNLAKISGNGQITVPMEIRRELNVKTGDKIIFIRNSRGEIIMQSLQQSPLMQAQRTGAEKSVVGIAT